MILIPNEYIFLPVLNSYVFRIRQSIPNWNTLFKKGCVSAAAQTSPHPSLYQVITYVCWLYWFLICTFFFNTEFQCMYNKTYYSKIEYFVRHVEYCLDTIQTISITTSPFTCCAWAGGMPVTSRLHLWSCRINHNISATLTQPYRTDRHINPVWTG